MAGTSQCEFMLVRYVPNAIKGESVNLGLVLLNKETGGAEVRFTHDTRRLRCLDPEVDVEMLDAIEREIRERLNEAGENRERILHLLRDSFSNAVQVSAPAALLTEAPEKEMNRLESIYLKRLPRSSQREHFGRGAIVDKMREAFKQSGAWDLMRKDIPAAAYTHPGDPLKIDCGYQPNGVVKFFHAVSLTTNPDAAKVLAFSYPQVREGVARVNHIASELTAIIEPSLPRQETAISFALETLTGGSILIATTDDLIGLSEIARKELRV
jgi:Protein of unknown function (DUF3037)